MAMTKKRALEWLAFALVAVLAVSVLVIGLAEKSMTLMLAGLLFVLMSASFFVWAFAVRPGSDGGEPSLGEKAAWAQTSGGMALLMLLVVQAGMDGDGVFAPWLLFFALALGLLFRPLYRRRFMEGSQLRLREVATDERDVMFLAQGERLSRRLLEISAVVLAVIWLSFPDFIRGLHGPMQVAALLFAPVFVANIAGDARIAWLYWRDRQ